MRFADVRTPDAGVYPKGNGFAEDFIGTFKRDYVYGAELRDVESVLAQLAG
jgi:hypothetical protein